MGHRRVRLAGDRERPRSQRALVPGRAPCILVITLALLSGTAFHAAAQATPGPTLRLAAPQTPPGGETFVTYILEDVPSPFIHVIKSELTFPSDHLEYVAARMGIAAELANATMDVTESKVEPPAARDASARPPRTASRLTITLTGKKPLPNGALIELRFHVKTQDQTTLKLDQKSEAFTADGTKVASLVAAAGEVRVSTEDQIEPPKVFACFFYMH